MIARWQRFWFRPIPSALVAYLRMAFGLVGLAGVVGLIPVPTFWALDGLVAQGGSGGALRETVQSIGLESAAAWGLFFWLVMSFACLTAGIGSFWAVVACFSGTVLQSFWNPLPLSGAHDVLTVMLFCLLWADCSASPSVDGWMARRGWIREPPPAVQPITPIRLMRIQVALIYMNSALWKLGGPTWRDGSSIHYVLNLNTFQRIPIGVPVAFEPMLTVLTYATLFWEMTFGLLLLNVWTRRAALLFGIALHLGLWLTLELGTFSWVMLASYLAFLDPEWVNLTGTDQKPTVETTSTTKMSISA